MTLAAIRAGINKLKQAIQARRAPPAPAASDTVAFYLPDNGRGDGPPRGQQGNVAIYLPWKDGDGRAEARA